MESNTPRARKAAAREEELRRLKKLREERGRERGVGAWQEFQVDPDRIPELRSVVEAAVKESGENGGRATRALRGLLAGRDCPGARELLLDLIQTLPSESGIEYLIRLHTVGVEGIADISGFASVLTSPEKVSPQDLVSLPRLSPEVDLWCDARLVLRGQRPRYPESFVASAPLPLLDDLIDQDVELPSVRREHDEAADRYLLARSRPAELTDTQVNELGWEEELWRRRLLADPAHPVPDGVPEGIEILAGIAMGDPDALEAAGDSLSGGVGQMVRQVLDHPGRPAGWPTSLVEEPALWPVLDHFCEAPPGQGWSEGEKPLFAQWRELWAARRELLGVSPKAFEFLQGPLRSPTRWVREEAVSMEVYLDLRFSEPGDMAAPRQALKRLKGLRSANPIVLHNISWLSRMLAKDRNNRGPLINPYLELGVPQGAATHEWKAAWRELRRRLKGRPIELSDVNLAHDMLRDTEAPPEGEHGDMYVLPVHPNHLSPPPRVAKMLIREPRPMKRCTKPLSPEEDERLRVEAMGSLVRAALTERTR